MARTMLRLKWLVMKGFGQQKVELFALVIILAVMSIFATLLWEASRPIDGTFIDLSEQHQIELIDKFRKQKLLHSELKQRQRSLDIEDGVGDGEFDDKFFDGRVGILIDAKNSESKFNASKHLQENPHDITLRRKYDPSKDRLKDIKNTDINGALPVKVKRREKMIKYYDPNQGRMVYKPAIVEETELEGGPGQSKIYDLSTNLTESYDCISLNIKPITPICLYPTEQDIHISGHIRDEGIWEPHIVRDFQNILYGDPDLSFIDIGANIGQYSLIAAAMGHKVLAVEPYIHNIKRLHRAAQEGNLVKRITVLQNAISDTRKKWFLKLDSTNQGGVSLQMENPNPDCTSEICRSHTVTTVHLDDLLEVITFRKAVMKIDIEGHEHRAFLFSDKFFKKIYVPYIFMEWMKLRQYYGSEITQTEDKRLTQRLVKYLLGLGYHAYSSVTMQKLNPDWWVAWTDDIIWKHELHEIT